MGNIRLAYTNHLEQVYGGGGGLLNGSAVVVAANSCVSGSPSITRASGSYLTDGVKRWSLLSGAIAARFPANTRVTNVASGTLTMSANATSSTGATESGTFTPTFLKLEDAAYPVVNLINGQRYVPWDTGPGSFPVAHSLEFDFGATRSINLFALLGMTWSAALGISVATISSGSVYGTYTLRGTITAPNPGIDRDLAVIFSSVVARYWKIDLAIDARTVLGAIFAADMDQDLGTGPGVGTTRSRRWPVARQETPAGSPIYTRMGDYEARTWNLNYEALLPATRAQFEAAYSNRGLNGAHRPIVLIDEADQVFEVEFVNSRHDWTNRFTNVDQTTIALESLP